MAEYFYALKGQYEAYLANYNAIKEDYVELGFPIPPDLAMVVQRTEKLIRALDELANSGLKLLERMPMWPTALSGGFPNENFLPAISTSFLKSRRRVRFA